MKILVVCQYYYPENFQITPICEQLVKDGYDVTVLTGLPNYPMGIVPEEYKSGHRDEYINGVHILRCFEIGRGKGPIGLAKNYLSFLWSSMRKINELPKDFDLVFVYQLSPVLMGLPARKYAQKYNRPLFLYCCDLWPESIKTYIKNESNSIFRFVKYVSTKVYSACDKIACQSSSFLPYLHAVHNLVATKLVYLPAFADEAYLDQDFIPDDNGVVDFVFMGNLGIAQNLGAVLEAVNKIKHIPGFKLHFVGDGSYLATMQNYVAQHNLQDIVVFHGRHAVEEMPQFYKLADVCLVSLKADSAVGLTLPSKVQGYMAAGKPILGMINGSAQKVIDEANCGICVKADDMSAFADAMCWFINNFQEHNRMGQNGREYFKQNFSKKIFMRRLECELEGLIEK